MTVSVFLSLGNVFCVTVSRLSSVAWLTLDVSELCYVFRLCFDHVPSHHFVPKLFPFRSTHTRISHMWIFCLALCLVIICCSSFFMDARIFLAYNIADKTVLVKRLALRMLTSFALSASFYCGKCLQLWYYSSWEFWIQFLAQKELS